MIQDLDEETCYHLLSLIEEAPEISQRQRVEKMSVSVGKANCCVKTLVDVGHLNLENFRLSKDRLSKDKSKKLGYVYFLTP